MYAHYEAEDSAFCWRCKAQGLPRLLIGTGSKRESRPGDEGAKSGPRSAPKAEA